MTNTPSTPTADDPHALRDLRDPGRRRLLGVGSAAAFGLVVAACSSSEDSASTSSTSTSTTTTAATGDTGLGSVSSELATGTPSTTVFTAADFAALGICMLSLEQTEGPYPTETQIERRDVTEGLEGMPLRLGLQVVDESCQPVAGADVEIWHCDVDGDYSAYSDGATADDAGPGTTFLRGSQRTNGDGIVEFHSNYPGWYSGRAVHIHTKVHLDDTTVLTSQIFFPDDFNETVLATEPYSAHGSPDTTNAQDSIAGDPAANGTLATTSIDAGTFQSQALLVLGIDPDAVSTGSMGAGGGPGGPPPA